MPDPQEPPKPAYGSTYFVQDRRNKQEIARVTTQSHMLTTKIGGVLPEQPDPSIFQRVLDIGCGTGRWIIAAAQAYPTMSLFGIDISSPMIAYARQQAAAHHVADRTEFRVMDAPLTLEFPPDFFDLVNLRLGGSFLRTWEWPRLLNEMQRITRSGGIISVTDADTTNPAVPRFYASGACYSAPFPNQDASLQTKQPALLLTCHVCLPSMAASKCKANSMP
jgi:ubiquinone/menaquinone biosynthesis C-methylase UbiE